MRLPQLLRTARRLLRRLRREPPRGHLHVDVTAVEPGRRRRRFVDVILDLTGTDWGGNHNPPNPPSLYSYEVYGPPTEPGGKPSSVTTRWVIGREYTDELQQVHPHGLVRVFATWPGDGHELWCGYPSEWLFHCDMATAKRLAWWILWHWWAKSHWFGLRRWIYFGALSYKLNRYRRQRPDPESP